MRKLDSLVKEFDLGKPLNTKKVDKFFKNQSNDLYRHMKRTLATKTKFLQNFGIMQKQLDAYISNLDQTPLEPGK